MSEVKLIFSRKNHLCKYCDRQIFKGEKYFHVAIFPWSHPENDGFSKWSIHEACKPFGDEFFWDDDAKGIFPDYYQSEFREFMGMSEEEKESER